MNDQILTVINFINDFNSHSIFELIANREAASDSKAFLACASAVFSKFDMLHAELKGEPLEDHIKNTINQVDKFFEKTGGNKRNYPQYKGVNYG